MSGQRNIRHAYIIYINRPESIQYANECAQSCEQYGLPYTLWEGIDLTKTLVEDLPSITGFKWQSKTTEMGCTASHLKLWHTLAAQPHASCVFEHDVILRHNIYDLEIPDDKLVMLGFRVGAAEDYQYPGGDVSFIDITKFEGTHAYAVTPNMARAMIDRMSGYYTDEFGGVDTTIDGILSIHDKFGIQRCVMDPPPAVCVVGNRISTIQGKPAEYNISVTPGFEKGMVGTPLRVT